jgi:hypothetical protein
MSLSEDDSIPPPWLPSDLSTQQKHGCWIRAAKLTPIARPLPGALITQKRNGCFAMGLEDSIGTDSNGSFDFSQNEVTPTIWQSMRSCFMFGNRISALAVILFFTGVSIAMSAEKDSRLYELRTYYSPPGKLDALHARFRDHTTKLFEKHGMTNVGYWIPIENPDNKLIYILSYPNRESREKSWKAFLADPAWMKVQKETEANGAIVSKVDKFFLTPTDYSPEIKPSSAGDRVFELRTYTATPGNLVHLHARFRDHTVKLFEKHGMTNIGYWQLAPDQPGADVTLIYILAHKNVDAAKASFDAFRKDPDWVKARTASEEKGGGSLTAQGGVKSEFMKATDYSTIK